MDVNLHSRGRRVYDSSGRCVKRCPTEAAAREFAAAFGAPRHKLGRPNGRHLVSRVTGLVPGLPGSRYHIQTRRQIDERQKQEAFRDDLRQLKEEHGRS